MRLPLNEKRDKEKRAFGVLTDVVDGLEVQTAYCAAWGIYETTLDFAVDPLGPSPSAHMVKVQYERKTRKGAYAAHNKIKEHVKRFGRAQALEKWPIE